MSLEFCGAAVSAALCRRDACTTSYSLDTREKRYRHVSPVSSSPKPLSHLELVRAAVLAPSPDNNQPWRFAGSDEQLSVYLDPQRALPSDVNAMFDLVGVGASGLRASTRHP